MDHFIDLTAIDYPERESARFDLVLTMRSSVNSARIRLRTYVKEGEEPGTLSGILGRRQLGRARGLGHVRDQVPGPPRHAAHPPL